MNNQEKVPELSKEIIEAAVSLEVSEMESILTELEGSAFWPAIIKYQLSRSEMAKNGLYTIDPIKEPTQVARFQGLLAGLVDLQNMVLLLKQKAAKAEAPKKDAS